MNIQTFELFDQYPQDEILQKKEKELTKTKQSWTHVDLKQQNTFYQHCNMKIVQMCVEDWKILLRDVICMNKSIENPETKFLLN